MKLETMHIVYKATAKSELCDVLMEVTVRQLMLQTLGGLELNEIVAVYTTKEEALPVAHNELDRVRLAV